MSLSDLWTVAVGGVSLFPLAGEFSKLRGFFPARYRPYHVLTATLFSLLVYIYIHWHFRNLHPYIPIWSTALFAGAFLGLYLVVFFSWKEQLGKTRGIRLGLMLTVTLLLYGLFTVSLTYTFNVLERFREYDVYYGFVSKEPGGHGAAGATVTLDVRSQSYATTSLVWGYYSHILDDDEADRLTAIRAEWLGDDGHYGGTLTAAKLRRDGRRDVAMRLLGE